MLGNNNDRTVENFLQDIHNVTNQPSQKNIWPLWEINLNTIEKITAGLLKYRSGFNIQLAPMQGRFLPSVFESKEYRNSFFKAYPNLGKPYFPLLKDMNNGKDLPPNNLYHMTSEVNLRIPAKVGDGQDRYVAFLSNNKSPDPQNCFHCPGGKIKSSPLPDAIQHFNKEAAIVIKNKNGQYSLLNIGNKKRDPSALAEKKKQLPLAIKRIGSKYKNLFGAAKQTEFNVKHMAVNLAPSISDELLLPIDTQKGWSEEIFATVAHSPKKRTIDIQHHRDMPSDFMGTPFTAIDGKNLFIVDVMSPDFERDVYLLTGPEIKYASQNNFLDYNGGSSLKQIALQGKEAPKHIHHWTHQGPVRQEFINGKLQTMTCSPK